MGAGEIKSEITTIKAYVVTDSTGAASVQMSIRNRACDTLLIFPSVLTIRTNSGVIIHPNSLQSFTDVDDWEHGKATHRPEPEFLRRKRDLYIYAWFCYPKNHVTVETLNQSGDLPLTLIFDSVRCGGANEVERIEMTLSSEARPVPLK